jgi:hypothetical protein
MNSLFHETKTPIMDMKVLVYFIFSKIKMEKKKSQSSMKNRRFHPSKCRGKVQNIEEETLFLKPLLPTFLC